jgi:hypothetical protein
MVDTGFSDEGLRLRMDLGVGRCLVDGGDDDDESLPSVIDFLDFRIRFGLGVGAGTSTSIFSSSLLSSLGSAGTTSPPLFLREEVLFVRLRFLALFSFSASVCDIGSSASVTSFVRTRFLGARVVWVTDEGVGDSRVPGHRRREHDTNLSSLGVESARNLARLMSV